MDNKHDILELLRQVADGKVSPENAMLELKEAPFEDLAYAKIDFHRSVRQGAAEVIYGEGKTPEQIKGIVERMGEKGCRNILVTRISQETGDYLSRFAPDRLPQDPPAWDRISGRPAGTGKYCGGHWRDQRHAGGRRGGADCRGHGKSCDPGL